MHVATGGTCSQQKARRLLRAANAKHIVGQSGQTHVCVDDPETGRRKSFSGIKAEGRAVEFLLTAVAAS
jgi:hypothetical protein